MKFWNKDKQIRKRCWTTVTVQRNQKLVSTKGGWVKVTTQPYADMKRWCQQQESNGKFYYYYGTDTWWFEHEHDATMFLLRWA